MKPLSICIACGQAKDDYQHSCSNCRFTPSSDEELAKSRILSEPPWDFGLPDGSIVSTGRTREQLESIAEQIRSGRPYEFPPDELEGMIWIVKEAEKMSGGDVVIDLLKWLSPVIAAAVIWFLIASL